MRVRRHDTAIRKLQGGQLGAGCIQFEQMLNDNLPIIDKWTILDTGSTDETIDIINRVLVGKKNGNLYQAYKINE